MKFLALSVILALAVSLSGAMSVDQALHQEWELFKTTHGKSYSESENEFRMKVFLENREKVAQHNARFAKGEETFTLAMNKFGDLLTHEFAALYNGYNSEKQARKGGVTFVKPENFQAPASIDWRKSGYVTPVKDQKQCGSCWAFSAVGALEGQNFRKTGQLVSLSEQNLVDCSTRNSGCNGGLMDYAFKYVKSNGGIDTESSYPYTARDGVCKYNADNKGGSCSGFVDVKPGSETDLMNAIAANGPVSIAIDASHFSFQMYSSGVYNEPSCSSQSLDHGVLAVGYGSDVSGDYWIVKNSWGKAWGESGYINMSRNKSNQCGVATEASYPTV